jgi:hypothetical protein
MVSLSGTMNVCDAERSIMLAHALILNLNPSDG